MAIQEWAVTRVPAAEDVVHEIMQFAREPFLQGHREPHLVASLGDSRGKFVPVGKLQQVLHAAAGELHIGRDGGKEFDERMIEQRHPALKPMRHAHPVLDLQQRRQEALEIEMRHLVEIGFLMDVSLVVEDRPEAVEHLRLVELRPIDLLDHVGRAVDKPEIALVERAEQPLPPELGHQRLVFAQQAEIGNDRLDRHDKIAVLVGAVERRLDALLEIGEQITRIAAKRLVTALAAKHDFQMFGSQARDHELRKGARPRHRKIEVIDDIGDVVAEMPRGNVDRVQIRTGLVYGCLCESALVIAGVVGEPAVKAIRDAALGLAGEDRDQARIDAARNIRADRHIAAQMHRDRVVEQLNEAALEIALVMLEIDVVADVPISPNLDLPLLDGKGMARQQLLHPAKQRRFAKRVLERQVFGERRRVGFDLRQKRHQRLRLRGKHKQIADRRIVERLDAEPVARAEQRLAAVVPDCEGEHPAQAIEAVGAVTLVSGENAFGV